MQSAFVLKDRSNLELLAGVKNLVSQECDTTAQIVAHLNEIDLRRLYLEEGYPSLFKYCTDVLHLTKSAAYRRIEVARVARRFPVIFEKLADGSVNLTTVQLLGPCLSEANHRNVLLAARHRSKEEVEELVVAMRPRPDVPSVIRKLPERSAEAAPPAREDLGTTPLPMTSRGPGQEPAVMAAATFIGSAAPPQKPVVAPLAPERYKIQFTADAETHQMLRQLQDLMRHEVPNGDLAAILKQSIRLYLEHATRRKLAQVKRPRKGVKSNVGAAKAKTPCVQNASRHIPADVKARGLEGRRRPVRVRE